MLLAQIFKNPTLKSTTTKRNNKKKTNLFEIVEVGHICDF